MTIVTLKDRIEKAETRIEKKRGTIEKKIALAAKKTAQAEKATDDREKYWLECDARHLNEDVKRLESEIKETEKTLENYRRQLSGEIARQDALIKEVPDVLKSFKNELVDEWDAYDRMHKDFLRAEHDKLGYSEFIHKYHYAGWEEMYKTPEQSHNENVRDAEAIVLNLVNRVKDIVGDVTSWEELHTAPDNHGYMIINGFVAGKMGRCIVESIGAGGYNIQRYHIRVLVKPLK